MSARRPFRLSVLKRAFIATLSFILGFLVLVVVQFSGRGKIKGQAGGILITGIQGSAPSGRDGEPSFPLSLSIAFEGIGFTFGDGKPLAAAKRDGSPAILSPVSWSKAGRRVSVELEDGAGVDFEAGTDSDSFSIHTRFGASGIKSLSLPYSLSGASFQANLGERLSVRTRDGTYTLGIPDGSRLDAERFTLTLGERKNAFSLALVRRPAKSSPSATQAAQFVRVDDVKWKAGLDAWINRCWAGLSKGRYVPEGLAWNSPAGPAFSDAALAVLIAESLKRGTYADIRPMVASLAKGRADALGWMSSVYLGDIIRKEGSMRSADETRSKEISRRLSAKDESVFLEPGIVHFCVDRAPSLLQPFLNAASNVDAEGMKHSTALGILLCLSEAETYFPDAENPFARLESAAIGALSPLVRSFEGNAYLPLDGEEADIALQARAGMALIGIGSFRDDDNLLGTGRALAASVVALSDENGVLPARVALAAGKPVSRSGALLPEDVYPFLSDNPWYPRPRSLLREAGKGTWVLSCSPRISVEWGAAQANISADWPVGAVHYMIVFGVQPVVLMRLYEIPYNPDPSFDRYNASGFLYARAQRILYLKMKHKAEREYIRMNF